MRYARLTYGLRLAVLAAALGLWQGLSAAGVIRADEFPSMSQTATALWDAASGSSLWTAVGQTLEGWALGLVIGVAAALLIGTLIGMNGFAYRSVIGVIEFFKAIPVIAILPIGLVLWGATLTMKFALVAFAVFWPLVIQVCYGVRSLDPVVRDTTTVLQVRGPRKFLTVILPSAAPFIATGLRVAVAVALIVDIIAELIGGGTRRRRAHPRRGERRPERVPADVRLHRGRRDTRRPARGGVHGGRALRAALARVPALREGGRSKPGILRT